MTTVEESAPAAVQHVSTIVVLQLAFALLVGGRSEWATKLILVRIQVAHLGAACSITPKCTSRQ